MSDVPVTFENFEIEYLDKANFNNSRLIDFMRFFIEEKQTVFAPNTIKRYNNCMVKIERFEAAIQLKQLDYNFINRFEQHLRNVLKNQHNTVAKEIKIIKTLFTEAQKRGYITSEKQLNYTINYKDIIKEFLTIEELKSLSALIDSDVALNIKKVLFPFVFSCFTGLRISDIMKLKLSDFKENFRYIDITTIKTKDRLIMPISEPTRAVIMKYMDFEKKRFAATFDNMLFFDTFSEQYGRQVLKTACELIGITKRITFHSGRYTFATICNSIGIPIEVTSRLLSHKTLKMTLKYAKFTDQLLAENISKWNATF